MKTKFSIQEIINHFPESLWTHKEAFEFIKENKLWQGLGQYGWLSKALAVLGIFAAWYAYTTVGEIAEEVSDQNMLSAFQTLGYSMSRMTEVGSDFVSSSYFKYVVFILMEVVIFHFARRTLEIKTNKKFDTSFNAFWEAEKRMLKVALRCAIIEFALTVAISATLSIFGLSYFKTIFVLILQCYFLGFLMMDNFNEIFHLTIKESSQLTRAYAGVALAIGLVSYILLMIPLVGAFLAPLLGAVTATLAMHRFIPAGPVSESHVLQKAVPPTSSE